MIHFREKYPFVNIFPGAEDPDWFIKAESIGNLAEKLEIDQDSLISTVDNFNKYVESGDDL